MDALDLGRRRVDRVNRPVEFARDKVVDDRRPYAAGLPGGADHGHRSRSQEVGDRGDGGEPLTVLELGQTFRGELGRKLGVHFTRLRTSLHWEATLAEHLQHAVVFRPDDRFENVKPGGVGRLGQLAEQDRAQTSPLIGVGYRQGELGLSGLDLYVHRMPDDLLRGPGDHDQAIAGGVVDLHHPLHG